jgi:hypothetical protein
MREEGPVPGAGNIVTGFSAGTLSGDHGSFHFLQASCRISEEIRRICRNFPVVKTGYISQSAMISRDIHNLYRSHCT